MTINFDDPTGDPDESMEARMKAAERLLQSIKGQKPHTPRKMGKGLSTKVKMQLTTAIDSRLSEFINCYAMFGFDVHGNSVVIVNTASGMESRAVSDLIDEYMSEKWSGDPMDDLHDE